MIYLENNPLTNKGTFTIYKESLLLINKETGEKKKKFLLLYIQLSLWIYQEGVYDII